MSKKKRNPLSVEFGEHLVELVAGYVGCSIQHNGCPCNSCFHTWAVAELELNPHLAHMFWIVVLALRGDYKQDEILESNIANFKEIIKEYKKGGKQ